MEEYLRKLERQANLGDTEALTKLRRLREQLNLCPDYGTPIMECEDCQANIEEDLWCLGDCGQESCHRCFPIPFCELGHQCCLDFESSFKFPCVCRGVDRPHEEGTEGCWIDEGPFCESCGKPCTAITEDFGIGPYEYWGAKGVDVNIQTVSDCCEASLYSDYHLIEPYEPEEYFAEPDDDYYFDGDY